VQRRLRKKWCMSGMHDRPRYTGVMCQLQNNKRAYRSHEQHTGYPDMTKYALNVHKKIDRPGFEAWGKGQARSTGGSP
jgi:hypothetical protein